MKKTFAAGVMATSAIVNMAGCDNAQQKTEPARPAASQPVDASGQKNVFSVLSGYQFIGQDGQPVNIAGLKSSLQNKYTTLTFGFAECENYCPMINNVLGKLGEVNPELTSIVIAANPEGDGIDQAHRDAFMQRLRNDNVRHNVVILYPTQGGQLSNATAPKVAMGMGSIVNVGSPLDHSAKVILCGPGGARLKDKSGLRPSSEFVQDWSAELGRNR